MAKANKHNRRAKKLKARKAATGSARKFNSMITPAGLAGADCIIDMTSDIPNMYMQREDGKWIKHYFSI